MAERIEKTKGKIELCQRGARDESKKETVTEINEEIITMKTEIKEELFDYQITDDIEFVHVKEMHLETDVASSENEMKSNRVNSTDNVQVKDEVIDDKEEIRIFFKFEETYRCEWCALEFDEATYLKNHYVHCPNKTQELAAQQNINRPQEEDYSNKKREPSPTVKEEMAGGVFRCNYCKLQIIDKEFYVRHLNKCQAKYSKLNREDRIGQIFKCSKCNYVALQKHYLAKHIVVHNDKKQFSCELCGKLFTRKESIKYHMKIHEGTVQKIVKTKRYKCDKCEFTAVDTYKLKKHMSQHNVQVREHKCTTCKFATHSKEYLKRHMFTHCKEKQFKCTYKSRDCTMEKTGQCKTCESEKAHMCEYAATQKSSLNMHILAHHSNKEKQYKCKICNFATHFKGHLKTHLLSHSDKKPFKCTYKKCNCPEKESCECSICDFSAISKTFLMSHIRQRHTKEKIYHCEKCPYGTANRSNLKLHVKRKHT